MTEKIEPVGGWAALRDGYFDSKYAESVDPWGFETRWYEKRKYAVTLAMLPRERYRRAFEPGCSVGALTALLAERCEEVLATDVAEVPLRRARSRGLPNVRFETASLRDGWPDGAFDLVVLSEMCYYFAESELPGLFNSAVSVLEPGGTVIAAHWSHVVDDYPTSAEQVHARLRDTSGLEPFAHYDDADVVIDVFLRTGGPRQPMYNNEIEE